MREKKDKKKEKKSRMYQLTKEEEGIVVMLMLRLANNGMQLRIKDVPEAFEIFTDGFPVEREGNLRFIINKPGLKYLRSFIKCFGFKLRFSKPVT